MHNISKRLLTLILAFLFSLAIRGQQPFIRNYTVDDGLPSSELYHVIQDSKGYIWIASNQGVSRFDGKTFKNYDVQDGLPENTVFEIFEDEIGRVWFITFPFQLSYFQNNSIHNYKYNKTLQNIAGHGLVPIKMSFLADSKNNVFFSFITDGKIYKIDESGNYNLVNEIKSKRINTSLLQIKDKVLISQNNVSALEYRIKRPNRKELTILIDPHSNQKYSYSHIISLKTNNGVILVAKNNLLIKINPDNSYQTYSLHERILWIGVDKKNFLWVGFEIEGACKYLIDKIDSGPVQVFEGINKTSSIFVDNQGGTWFSTLDAGLYYFPHGGFTNFNEKDGLSNKKVINVEKLNEDIYACTANGYVDIFNKGKKAKTLDFTKDRRISCIKAFKDSILWIATETFLYSYSNNKLTTYRNNHKLILNRPNTQSFLFSGIKDMVPVEYNKIYFGQMNGLSILEGKKIVYDSYLDDSLFIRIETIEANDIKDFYLGTSNGLWEYSKTGFKYLGKESPLLAQRITDIAIIKPDYQVIGTKGSGLVIRRKNFSLIHITQKEGLTSNSITSLLISGNELWVATNKGINILDITKLDSKKPIIRIFHKAHGLASNEVNKLIESEGKIYIATNGGLSIFDKDNYSPTPFPLPVYVQGVMINNIENPIEKSYSLRYNHNSVKFLFSGIDYRDGSNLKYKYRLVGLNDKWINTVNTEVNYAFLPPGNYRFEVIAINSEFQQSIKPAIISFIINPPFWGTWWFSFVIFVLSIGLIYYLIKNVMKRVQNQHKLQNDIYNYRQQALIRQMDPHFVFNTLNSIQSFIIKNDSVSSTQYLSKFSRLMRVILNNSQRQAVSINEEMDALSLYMELESMRFKQKFKFEINIDSEIDQECTNIPAFIIQPFIENCIWHGIMDIKIQGMIKIKMEKVASYIVCEIEDNGIGREKANELKAASIKEKKSMGISIVESRLTLLSNYFNVPMKLEYIDLKNSNGQPGGTKVIVNLPIVN